MNSQTTTHSSEFLDTYCFGNAQGRIEVVNNIVNMTVVSKHDNDLKAEYEAGYVQGVLQETNLNGAIRAARNNSWKNAYLTDPAHNFPNQIDPSQDELAKAQDLLNKNYDYVLDCLQNECIGELWAKRLKRLLFRMLGIYHGASQPQKSPEFTETWLPDRRYFEDPELTLGYGTDPITFMDVYFINAYNDLMDVIASSHEICVNGLRSVHYPDRCTAFLKRLSDGDIVLTHNSWMGFLSQTMCQTVWVNDDGQTINAVTPGLIGSGTDFGFNNKGIMFNETTHRIHDQPKTEVNGLWIFWRATLAEQFASSVPEFFEAIELDNTGTYLNGYMIVDAKTNETGLVEMSGRCFVEYYSDGGPYKVECKCLDGGDCSTDYDKEMVTASYLMGINFPASYQVRSDLGLEPERDDNRPARREQLKKGLPDVNSLDNAWGLITYVDDPGNPLSIFGRWDLGYGRTPSPKQVPDGSVDAKAASASMAASFMKLEGTFADSSSVTGFYMLFGTPHINGKPFIWSESIWSSVVLDYVPDVLDGEFTKMRLYLK